MIKICSANKGCGQEKDLSEFRYDNTKKHYRHICKECERSYFKLHYMKQDIKQKVKKRKRLYKVNNREKLLLKGSQYRAKRKGIEHNITLEDIQIPEYCPILGIKLELGEGRQTPNSPTLDRVDNNRGYVKGNIEVISWRANNLKKDATVDELERILKHIKGNGGNE